MTKIYRIINGNCLTLIPLNCLLAERIRAYDQIWFFGDEFVERTFEKHYKQRKEGGYPMYAKKHFDLFGYSSSKYKSADQNMISRYRNLMPRAINEHILYPKMIIVVPDDDFLKFMLPKIKKGISESFGKAIDGIMRITTDI